VPGAQYEEANPLDNINVKNARADLAARLRPFVSEKWLLTRVLGFTSQETEEILMDRRYEASGIPTPGGDLAPLMPQTTETPQKGTLTIDDVEDARRKLAEEKKAANDIADIEYFKRNMRKALKIPKDYLESSEPPGIASRLKVGANDIFVIDVDVSRLPSNRIEEFLTKCKDGLRPLWEKVGLIGRIMCVASDHNGFRVIEVEEASRQGYSPEKGSFSPDAPRHVHIDLAKPAQKKPRPPVMG